MNSNKFFFFLNIVIVVLAVAVGVALAWTSPSANPPSGGGALYYSGGNVGIGTASPYSPAPNSQSGNLDTNDVYLRSASKWASQGVTPANVYVGTITCTYGQQATVTHNRNEMVVVGGFSGTLYDLCGGSGGCITPNSYLVSQTLNSFTFYCGTAAGATTYWYYY